MSQFNDTLGSKSYQRYLESRNNSYKYGNSSFWMDDLVTRQDDGSSKFDLFKMVQYQRAIANFVKILSKKDIPVIFSSKDESKTDGKTQVVLSGKIDDKSFDVTTGLALHEASHILLTDFEFTNKLFENFGDWNDFVSDNRSLVIANMPYFVKRYPKESDRKLANLPSGLDRNYLFSLLNWVEDRRIDREAFNTSPGYKAYYHALYDKYFWNKDITKGLLSSEFRTEDAESYMFRILGLTNPKTDTKALRGLQTIINIVDLHNIGRLKSTKDSLDIAMQIFDVVIECCHAKDAPKSKPQPKPQPGPGENSDESKSENENGNSDSSDENDGFMNKSTDSNKDKNTDSKNDSTDEDNSKGDASGEDSDESKSENENTQPNEINNNGADAEPLSSNELIKLQKAMSEMNSMVNGKVKKAKANKTIARMAQAIGGSKDFDVDTINYSGQSIPVLAIRVTPNLLRNLEDDVTNMFMDRSLRKEIALAGSISDSSSNGWERKSKEIQNKIITSGLTLGNMLGRKLQIRDQVKDTKFNRLKAGRIDGRLLHQCGYDVLNIFQKIESDKFTPSVIDISIDASSSMSGNRWINTQTAVLAIAKACSMIQNIQVKISYRYNFNINSKGAAIFVDVYNSTRDKNIKNLINCIFCMKPVDCTSDSLITQYQLNKKLITPGSSEINSYFINFSDGGPGCTVSNNSGNEIQYGGFAAHDHIKKCRKEIESMNVKVLSYFIGSGRENSQFSEDWGKQNSVYIDVTEIVPLAKSLNTMFLSK